ncbi:hypothetical protein SAMN02745150_01477 [Brevinema andersonii]|uniref:Outer membrane protein beta-barrel domain-containing protein n=1 Tax=Brevinema andersonii TaxID=34097 RepID=A0A1I1FKK7_BREAD|nr:hypothetical protein [Brevinema andersonii]SFB97643.1 hypothetical protein SAMN02745150_01477 [Brevinema andersonii]
MAFGVILNADVNLFGGVGSYDYSFAISTTLNMHVTLEKYLDWYVGLGFGIQMFPTWTRHTGPFALGAGFDTGFNVYFNSHIGWSIGMSILAEQITGTTGIKFKFSGL